MKKRRFLFGFIAGVVSTVLGIVILFSVYYYVVTSSETFEKVIAKRLNPPEILIVDASCYQAFDHNLEYYDLNGTAHELNSISDKVVFINLWTTTCIPCIAEMESINKLYNRFKEDNVEFILISPEKPEVVKEFYMLRNFDFPVYTILKSQYIESAIYTKSYPATYLITKSKTLALKEKRAANWYSDNVIELIESLDKFIARK